MSINSHQLKKNYKYFVVLIINYNSSDTLICYSCQPSSTRTYPLNYIDILIFKSYLRLDIPKPLIIFLDCP